MRRNRVAIRFVVLVVGTIRGVGAALAAAVLVLSGCGSAEVDTTTTSPAPEVAANPWELPLEERPPLFDPCTEIPIEAIEEGVGSKLEYVEEFRNYRPGELITCGWKNSEIHFTTLSTWKSREEFLTDRSVRVIDPISKETGRASLQMKEAADTTDRTCLHLYFTNVGSVMVKLDLVSALREFNGRQLTDGCSALSASMHPIITFIPTGSN